MKQSFRERYSYKGMETTLNGLTLWIQLNHRLVGNADQKYNQACRLVVEYVLENYRVYFINQGTLFSKAHRAARLINKSKSFNNFTEFVNKKLSQ